MSPGAHPDMWQAAMAAPGQLVAAVSHPTGRRRSGCSAAHLHRLQQVEHRRRRAAAQVVKDGTEAFALQPVHQALRQHMGSRARGRAGAALHGCAIDAGARCWAGGSCCSQTGRGAGDAVSGAFSSSAGPLSGLPACPRASCLAHQLSGSLAGRGAGRCPTRPPARYP